MKIDSKEKRVSKGRRERPEFFLFMYCRSWFLTMSENKPEVPGAASALI